MNKIKSLLVALSLVLLAAPARAEELRDVTKELRDALVEWTKQDASLVEPWARAIVDVCTTRRECVRMASLAFHESRMFPWVLDQRCNDAAWRKAQKTPWIRESCDGGHAYGPWQVHDARFAGMSPAMQANAVLFLLRAHPELWTTRVRSERWAARWLAAHP